MSASSGKRKVKNLRISRVSLPVTKKRKLTDFKIQTFPAMENSGTDAKPFSGKIINLPTPVKSQNDKKEYRYIIPETA